VEFSSNLSAIYTKSCAQTFPPIFGFFEIFERNFTKLVALSDNNNQNYLVHLKGQSMLRNDVNIIKIDPKTTTQHLFKVCCHRTNSVPASERDKITKKTNKHHVFAPTAGARCTIFPNLCMVIELVDDIKKVYSFFVQLIVFPTGCTEKFGLINRCAVSQQ